MGKSLGYERMFWKPDPAIYPCTQCGGNFTTFSELYSHKELWHGKPIIKLNGITTIGDTSG